jgi:hypothetical protein
MSEHRVLIDDVLYIVEEEKMKKLKAWLQKNGLEAGEVKTDLDEDIVYEFEATESVSSKLPPVEMPKRRSKKNED